MSIPSTTSSLRHGSGRSVALAGSLIAAVCAMTFASSAWAVLPIKICSVDDRSGAAADTGMQGYQGLQIAVAEVNAAGGIAGRKVEVVAYDGKTDPQLTATFATRCAEDDKGLVIIGGNPAAPAAAMIPVATEYSIPFLMLSAGTDNLTDEPAPFHFRVGPRNAQDASATADMLAAQGFKRVAMVYNSLPFGVDSAQANTVALEKKKIAIVARQTYDINATDLAPQIANLRNANPDVILVFPYPADGARVLRTLRQLDVKAPIVVARSALLETMRKLAAESSDGVLIPNTVDPARADVKKFLADYSAKFGPVQPTMYPVLGYDAAKIAFQVIAQPKVLEALDKDKLADARKAFRDGLESIGKFKGLQGQEGATYQFGPKRHHGSPDENWFTFIQVTGKGAQLVKPDMAAFKPK